MKTITQPPALDHDAMMAKRFNVQVSPDGHNERRIVWNLCAHLREAGFDLCSVDDGEDIEIVSTVKEAMELVFNLDEAKLRFRKPGFKMHVVLLIMGNGNKGLDLIADYGYTDGDPDKFMETMELFDTEVFA